MKIEEQLQKDFRYFLTAVWTHLNLPAPTRAQLCIAEYLQHGPKRLQIQAFRGVGKSWITAAFVLWTLFNNPDKKIMVVSASKDRADSFSIFCQRLILEVPWLSQLNLKTMTSVGHVYHLMWGQQHRTKHPQLSLWVLQDSLQDLELTLWY